MYKNPGTGVYEHDFRVSGVPRYHLSYGVTKKADAEQLHATATALFKSKQLDVIEALRRGDVTVHQLSELRTQGRPFSAALELAKATKPWPTIGDAVDQYVAALEANPNKADSTARSAAQQLKRFVTSVGADTPIDKIGASRVTAYQAELIEDGYKTNTVTAYVWRVGSLYHWFRRLEEREAREEGRVQRSLYVPIDLETISSEKTSRIRFLAVDEAERLMAATPGPLLFPVAAGLFAGLRVDEMIHLRTQFDIDLDMGLLAIQIQPEWRPKTKRSIRHVPIGAALRPILERHLELYSSDEWVTPSFRDPAKPLNLHTWLDHFGRVVETAELIRGNKDPMGVTFHTLRHTFASWLLMRGVDIYTVAKLLGNSPSQVEKTYGHLSKDFRQQAVDRLSGAVTLPSMEAAK